MSRVTTLVLGTRNAKKGRELADLVANLGLQVVTLAYSSSVVEVDETGSTFAENAAIKAIGYARQTEQWVLADDSGIEVEALGGAPGVFSARYAGPTATDSDNNRLLLERLAEVPTERRTARYVCHVALSNPTGTVVAIAEDYCYGRLLTAAEGTGGFGYDPLFEVVEYHRTFGCLSPAVKACISHRARAFRRILPAIVAHLQPKLS